MPKLGKKKYSYTKKGIMQYVIDKAKKKRKKKGRNGQDYGQIPTGNATENPIGGNRRVTCQVTRTVSF